MAGILKNTSKYRFTEQEAKVLLSEKSIERIIRLSAVDLVKYMDIEDLKKIFHFEQKDPVSVGSGKKDYEIVVSIEIKD